MIPEHLNALAESCAPPDDRPIAEWCKEHVNLPASYVPPGFFKPEKSRWLLPALEALKDDRWKTVNLLKPTGTGGTLCADLYAAWRIVNRPGSIQWNWNAEELATTHAEERFWPLVENCKPLRDLTSENRHEVRTLARKFKNGCWLRIQAGTERRLQGRHIPCQINDEVWQWDAGRMRDADARLGAFKSAGLARQLNISQGGDVGTEWHSRCQSGVQVKWMVPCESCRELFFPVLEEKVSGKAVYRLLFERDGTNIRLQCPNCQHEMRDTPTLKAFWNEHGQAVNQTPDKQTDVWTYQWPAFVALPWQRIVDDYMAAIAAKKQGSTFLLRQFLQKTLAEFWDESVSEIDPVEISTGDYSPGVSWQVEHKPTMTVDCQKNLTLFYVVARGWASNGESRRLFRGRVSSFDEIASIQRQFNMSSSHVAIDVGYEQTPILQECARRIDANRAYGWFGLKGVKDEQGIGFQHVDAKTGQKTKRIWSPAVFPDMELGLRNQNVEKFLSSLSPRALELYKLGKLRIPIYLWSNRLAYETLVRLRDNRGAAWLAPIAEAGQEEEKHYREQLGAKVLKDTVDSRGNPLRVFESVRPGFPDHYWDCEAMQVVMASMAGALIGV